MKKYIGAIDQGTTSSRFFIFDHEGTEISRAQKEHRQIFPQPGWVEHDPLEILRNTEEVMQQALHATSLRAEEIAAIGITNQRETTVLWNPKTGIPYANAIVWQDMRTDQIVAELQSDMDWIRKTTGLPPSTYFSAPKIAWLFRNVPHLRRAAENGELFFGNIDTWLIWNLTGGSKSGLHVTDMSNASRTMLLDLATGKWCPDLLERLAIPQNILPAILPSMDPLSYSISRHGIPICADLGDQQAALVGQTCFDAGQTKNTYGTGNFLLTNTGTKAVTSTSGLLTTIHL